MMFKLISEKRVGPRTSVFDFGESVDIWWIKPHVANRRLVGCIRVQKFELDYEFMPMDECLCFIDEKLQTTQISECSVNRTQNLQISDERNDTTGIDLTETSNSPNLSAFLRSRDFQKTFAPLFTYFCEDLRTDNTIVKCLLRKLIPRCQEKFSPTYEMVLMKTDHSTSLAMFLPLCSNQFEELILNKTYLLCFDEPSQSLQLSIHKDFYSQESPSSTTTTPTTTTATTTTSPLVASVQWLEDTLLHKLVAWAEAASQSEMGLRKEQSLCLIDVEAYSAKYTELKKKYGPYFVKIWPESTDALKFVYEDIGIATYLLILWQKERKELNTINKQSFVDVGCGNGLLVHILSSEGHPGRGIDINKRKIWSLYGDQTILQEESLIPNQYTVEEDWIIGNHSDELTPWIPIIAARSSNSTRYFVLPCCFFDFNSKYHHVDHKKSHYESYLDYIRSIGEQCHFKVQQDTLRIPSTKRVCHIGTTRYRDEQVYKNIHSVIEKILTSTAQNRSQKPDIFIPRSSEVVVRNCSRVKESTKMNIIEKITCMLLDSTTKENNVRQFEDRLTSRDFPWSQWNAGGSTHLNDLVQLFDTHTLKELKSQCGGLQTLLKNNRNVFKVVGGMVQLRDYRLPEDLQPSRRSLLNSKSKKSSAAERFKTKLCWFHVSHPQGCLYTSEQCDYAHGTEELRDGV